MQLALSSDPDEYLDGAALAERAGDRQASRGQQAYGGSCGDRTAARRGRSDETAALADPPGRAEEAAQDASRTKLADARQLLASLTAARARRVRARGRRGARGRASRVRRAGPSRRPRRPPAPRASAPPPTPGRPRAVAFAYGELGRPYVWGATGPNAFDCSGLTQAACRAAGVSLPRTTYTQINAGQRVSRSELAPGDLVFFYSGISHVGLYIGDGQMIHAPHPGAPVRMAPIDEMPFAGATRVA